MLPGNRSAVGIVVVLVATVAGPLVSSPIGGQAGIQSSIVAAQPPAQDASTGTANDPPPPREGFPIWVPIVFTVLASAAAVMFAMILDNGRYAFEARVRPPVRMWVVSGITGLALFASGWAVGLWWAELSPAPAPVDAAEAGTPAAGIGPYVLVTFLIVLALLTLAFVGMFVGETRRRATVIETHWGGFGGGLGGLQIPASLLYLVAGLGFASMLTMLITGYRSELWRESEPSTTSVSQTAPPDTLASMREPAAAAPTDTTAADSAAADSPAAGTAAGGPAAGS